MTPPKINLKEKLDPISDPNFEITSKPFPASQKIYISGEKFPEIKVPMREVTTSEKMGRACSYLRYFRHIHRPEPEV
jgi:hypothetical protein